jgi:ComF family protein
VRSLNFGTYSGTLREAIRLLKFQSVKRLARPLGMLLAGLNLPSADCIVPVPLSAQGLRERGFNQSLLVARHLSRASGMPLEKGVLYKMKDTLPQVGLTRSARLQNLRGAFGTRENLKGKTVLLVDDVITTGATITECTKTLLKDGAGEVYAASLARTGTF